MLGITDDFANYQSAWEQAKDIPGGLPLRRRAVLPDCLSPQEIADLIYDYPEDIKAARLLIERAVSFGEIKREIVFYTSEPADPGMVVRNLYSHIRILEKRLGQFETDIVQLVEKISKQTDTDIQNTRKTIAISIQREMAALRDQDDKEWDRSRIWRDICGSLLSSKSRMPIRGQTGIGYDTVKQRSVISLIHRDQFSAWLKDKGEWPLKGSTPLSRWFTQMDEAGDKPMVRAARIEALKLVAEDLQKAGENPLAFTGKVKDVYNLCREKAIAISGKPFGFTSLQTWRNHFWHKRPHGILDIADPRSTNQKL